MRTQSLKKKQSISERQLSDKKLFENLDFDEEGKCLVMHHFGAAKYYKLNLAVVLFFFGFSYWTYKVSPDVFYNEKLAKIYIGLIVSGLAGMWIFSHK